MSNANKSQSNKKIHIISLGCPKNRIDTEAMMGKLEQKGYHFTNDIKSAGTVIVNTCGFLQEAVEEGLAEISAWRFRKRRQDSDWWLPAVWSSGWAEIFCVRYPK